MEYRWDMVKMNIILAILIWPAIINGHVTWKGSISSIEDIIVEDLPKADAHIDPKGSNFSTRQNTPQLHSYKTVDANDDQDPDSLETSSNNSAGSSEVSYDVFLQYCNLTDTRLSCDSFRDESSLNSTECIPFSTNTNLTSLLKNRNQFMNLTKAVFCGRASFPCFGAPFLFSGLLSNLQSLKISQSSEEVLENIIHAVKSQGPLHSLQYLTLTSDGLTSLKSVSQLFSIKEESDGGSKENIGSQDLLPNLEILDLSYNDFSTFNLSPFYNIPNLILNSCSYLKTVTVEEVTSQSRISSLTNFSLSDNPELVTISPWVIPSSPKLSSLDLSSNPNLKIYPTTFFSNSLWDNVNLQNSSFICDCNINSYKTKFFRHLMDRNCTSPVSPHQQFNTQRFLESSLCSNNSFSPNLDAVASNRDNVSAFVNSKVVINCNDSPEPIRDILANQQIPTHVAWITPTNNILVWIRQYVPTDDDDLDADELLSNNTANMQKEIRKNFYETMQTSHEAWDHVLKSECVRKETYTVLSRIVYFGGNFEGRVKVIPENGSLLIQNMGWGDRGKYRCFTWNNIEQVLMKISQNSLTSHPAHENEVSRSQHNSSFQYTDQINDEITIHLKMDTGYRQTLYRLSLVYGFATAGLFLMITLLAKLIYFLLHNYGCCLFCCCCKDQLPPKAKRLKTAMESIEAYRTQQLERLRENYHQQSDWIRQNCANQMEKVRDNYNCQTDNIKGFRQYGSTQLQGVRDQYYEQMHRIRDYSNGQLERVNENYIFQRQKLRKFSAQNYLKMRETKKYTQKTLNKVMENLPALYLDLTACRQGLRDRQPSLEWEEDEFQTVDLEMNIPNPPLPSLKDKRSKAFIYNATSVNSSIQLDPRGSSKARTADGGGQDKGSGSIYFTPSSTPLRELSSSPTKGTKQLYKGVYQQEDLEGNSNTLPNSGKGGARHLSTRRSRPPFIKTHRKSRSFSFPFMPSYWFGSNTTSSSVNDKPQEIQGDIGKDCDNENEDRVHHVLVERDACGSRDYLDVNPSNIQKEDEINVRESGEDNDFVKHVVGHDDIYAEYDESDALLPNLCQRLKCDQAEFEDNKEHNKEQINEESPSNGPTQIKNDPDRISLTSSSMTNYSSNKDTESSVMGITATDTTGTSTTGTGTSSSEISAAANDKAILKSTGLDTPEKDSTTDLLCGSVIKSIEAYDHNKTDHQYNSIKSINNGAAYNLMAEKITEKRKSM